ncbi:MAG TPA: epimerase, partial [bacterium]|nr:epimerase [bacterium]
MEKTIDNLKVIIFGASGMVGAAVLNECLKDSRVSAVLSVGRSSSRMTNPKLKELILPDLFNLESQEEVLKGYNACFFTLGVSA